MTIEFVEPQDKPWESEPDYEYFTHAGVECLVARMHLGHVNGYIALPHRHLWCNAEDVRDVSMNFLCPITFTLRQQSEFGDVLFMGFDTMSNNYLPKVGAGDPTFYRSFAWVREQTCKLAAEARSVGKVKIPRSKRKPVTHTLHYPWNLVQNFPLEKP